jgi:hypothetical protein
VALQAFDDVRIQNKLSGNPLIRKICGVIGRVKSFKERARQFYFEVILSSVKCPVCGGRLQMSGTNECTCSCGKVLDPTLTFQNSSCCEVKLVRKTFHYVCSCCHKTVPSRFLFDEKIFDKEYFREMMHESRERSKKKKEGIKRLLANSRSNALTLTENPNLESVPGLVEDLNDFIQLESDEAGQMIFDEEPRFSMNDYRNHINSILTWNGILFSEIVPLIDKMRRDKVWRFVTLVYMHQDREVNLSQQGQDILVKRVYHEAHA